jgi:hypothetical protein
MHFGPEWMRTKHQPLSRSQPPASPPLTSATAGLGLSAYSTLVSATPPSSSEAGDDTHPFRYSKDELLRIYQEGGGKGGLGLEVERWEGVVREPGSEPIALREMSETEKKVRRIFVGLPIICTYADVALRRTSQFRNSTPCESIHRFSFAPQHHWLRTSSASAQHIFFCKQSIA